MEEPEVRQIIERVLGGERESFSLLIRAYEDRLYTFIVRMVRNEEDARDIAQEAFLRAYGSLGRFRFGSRFSTWLFQIGYNAAISHIRRESKRRDIEKSWEPPGDTLPHAERLELDEINAAVDRALDGLNPDHRTSLHLLYREEKTYQEIAEIMDIPVNTVKSHIRRGKEAVRSRLQKEIFPGQNFSTTEAGA